MNFFCGECNKSYTKWAGVCKDCNSWNTIIAKSEGDSSEADNLLYYSAGDDVSIRESKFILCSSVFKDFFSNGIVEGSVSIIYGPPGVGKTTFLVNLLTSVSSNNSINGLYISSEEPSAQILRRFFSNTKVNNIFVSNVNDINDVFSLILKINARFVIIDSLQLITDRENEIFSTTIASLRTIISKIIFFSKKNKIPFVLVSQVVKDGSISGPKYVEHMVDTIFNLTCVDKKSKINEINVKKDRFGSCDRTMYFTLSDNSIFPINNLLVNFIELNNSTFGATTSISLCRDKLVFHFVEALVIENKVGMGKRVINIPNKKKLELLIAVIEKNTKVKLENFDIYININGPIIDNWEYLDLSVSASIMSSYYKKPMNTHYLIGSISLLGFVNKLRIEENIIASIQDLSLIGNLPNTLQYSENRKIEDVSSLDQLFI